MHQDHLNKIREKLRDHRMPVDTDQLWENIQRRKQPKRGLLWILLLFLFSIAAFSLVRYLPDASQDVSHKTENENRESEATPSENTQTNTQTIEARSQFPGASSLNPESEGSSIQNRYPQNQETKDYPSTGYNNLKSAAILQPKYLGNIQNPLEKISSESLPGIPNRLHPEQEKILFLNNEKTLVVQTSSGIMVAGVPPGIQIKNVPKMVFSLTSYGTADYISSLFSAADEYDAYLQSRLNSQKPKLSFRTGMQVQIDLRSGLYFKSGLEYGQIRESFYHLDTIQYETTLNDVHLENNINTAGDTSRIYGPAAVTVIQNKKWDVENQYSSLDLTLITGYRFGQDRLGFYVEAGLAFNLWSKFSGYILTPNGQALMADNYFKDNSGALLLSACGIEYPISSHLQLNLGISYKRNLSGIDARNNPVSQKNQMLGGLLGLRYYIGKLK